MNSHPYWHDAKNHPGEQAPVGNIPRRPDLKRQPGETNKDALLRLSGMVLAAEKDRDTARAAIERARDVAADVHDLIHTATHQPNATWGTVADFVASRLRTALDGEKKP